MKNIKLKQLVFISLVILLSFNIVFAAHSPIYDYFYNAQGKDDLDLTDITNSVFGIIMWLGYAIAICMILVTGIQFLTASPQKKAQLKEKLWIILLGVFILVVGVTLLNIVANIVQQTPINY